VVVVGWGSLALVFVRVAGVGRRWVGSVWIGCRWWDSRGLVVVGVDSPTLG